MSTAKSCHLSSTPLRTWRPRSRERDSGTRDEVDDGSRNEDLARFGAGLHARTDVHRDAHDRLATRLDLAGVQPGPDLQPERAQRIPNRRRAADRPGRTVERRQEPVARGVDLVSAEPRELLTHDPVVVSQQRSPTLVAELGGQLRRTDDVGEQHGRQHAVGVRLARLAGEKRLDLGEQEVAVSRPVGMAVTFQLDVGRAGHVLSEISAVLDGDQRVALAVQDQASGTGRLRARSARRGRRSSAARRGPSPGSPRAARTARTTPGTGRRRPARARASAGWPLDPRRPP